ncbi:Peptidyl-prolyl cis-trans isomerase B [compost metagenome]
MAHAGRNTGGSQFYIAYQPQPHLDGGHTVFGKVSKGMELVDAFKGKDKMEKVEVVEV